MLRLLVAKARASRRPPRGLVQTQPKHLLRHRPQALQVALGLGLGLMLAAPQWAPLLELATESARADRSAEVLVQRMLEPAQLLRLVDADALGNPFDRSWTSVSPFPAGALYVSVVALWAAFAAGCAEDPVCGNGKVEVGEQCDDGNPDDADGCTNACTLPVCGDAIVQAGHGEECDDGNYVDFDGCSNACRDPRCGDGILQTDEVCDDGNADNTDACVDVGGT